MMLTDLAAVLRAAGLDVVERPGWRERGHGQMSEVRCVVLHHTAGPAAGEVPSLRVVEEGRPDLKGPLAHLAVGRSGRWYVVAAGLCWHAGATLEPWQANAHAIGVEAEATGVDPWPAVQYDSLVVGARALADHYRVPYARVLGHREVAKPRGRKVDPNFDLDRFRAAVSVPTDPGGMPVQQCKAETAAAVWHAAVRNTFGDLVAALQVLNGIERRVTDLQDEVAQLHAKLDEKL